MNQKIIKLVFVLTFMLSGSLANAKPLPVQALDSAVRILDLDNVYYLLPGENISLEEAMRVKFQPLEGSFNIEKDRFLWFKLELDNSSNEDRKIYLNTYIIDYVEAYLTQNDIVLNVGNSGVLVQKEDLFFPHDYGFLYNTLPANSTNCVLYFKLENWYVGELNPNFTIFNQNGLHEAINENYTEWSLQVLIDLIFFGIVLFAFIIISSLAYSSKNRIYTIYAFYVFAVLLYAWSHMSNFHPIFGELFSLIPEANHFLNRASVFLFSGIYPWFLIAIFQLSKTSHSKLYYPLKGFSFFCLFYIVYLAIASYFHGEGIYRPVAALSRLLLLILHLYTNIYILFKVKNPFKWLILAGSTTLMILSLVGVLQVYIYGQTNTILSYELKYAMYLELGLLIELFFFSLAIGKFTFLLEKDKNQLLKDNIKQLHDNELNISRVNAKLQEDLAARTMELIAEGKEREKEQEKQIKVSYQLKLIEARLDTLRSQINPHFIFNSLNSIYNLVLKDENDLAQFYITEFSTLLRSILEYSRKETISIKEELDVNSIYLNLENYRLNNKLNIDVINEIEKESTYVYMPPLLLQPFLENAIWHGLIPSQKEEKNLSIHLFRKEDDIFIRVTDNGIGREASSKKVNLENESLGFKISEERIKLFNLKNKEQLSIRYEDLMTKFKKGTIVEIKIKLAKND